MAAHHLAPVLQHIRAIADPTPTADLGDGPLLNRFVHRGDEAAFAELVRRHGPLVLGVCRRILGDAHAAEDAFQATFLLLAKKGRSVAAAGPARPMALRRRPASRS
jgi:DNA-directed RNA polymerase specialized sigma24 family protein